MPKAACARSPNALDTLRLDGIGLLTSYAGKPLGDPSFAPIFDELNRPQGHAVRASHHVVLRNEHPRRQPSAHDFSTDTTRALASLAIAGPSRAAPTSSSFSPMAAERCR